MERFMAEHVRPFEGTGDFDLVVHAAPAEDVGYGADRPHVPLVTVSYRRPSPSSPTSTRAKKGEDFKLKLHGREMGRLAAEVSSWSGQQEEDVVMQAAFQQMAMQLARDPQLRREMGLRH